MDEYCYRCMQPMQEQSRCPHCGSTNENTAKKAHQLPAGTLLHGRYLLGYVLGSGGFGITYIGRDLHMGRRIAVKEYFPPCAYRVSTTSSEIIITDDGSYYSRQGMESFIREAQTLAKLPRMPGIVAVFDYFEENGTAYIVMEYLDGVTLKEYTNGKTISADLIFAMMAPVEEALKVVHAAKLVHRDISPDNLMVRSDGTLTLMDFGAARSYSRKDQSMTMMVKHGFAPEEQYQTHGNIGPWTDIYALCATIYKCITGINPP